MTNEFAAIFAREGDWYIALCPEIPGANGQGRSKEEARDSLASAIALVQEDRREGAFRASSAVDPKGQTLPMTSTTSTGGTMRPWSFIVISFALAASAVAAQPEVSPVASRLIAGFEANPARAPGALWQFRYQGETVYFVADRACCDLMTQLYDARGKLICHPSGGIAGRGDGKCPDFLKQRSDAKLLWHNPSRRAPLLISTTPAHSTPATSNHK